MTIRAVIFDLGHTLWDIGPDRGQLQRAYEGARAVLCEKLGRNHIPDATALREAVRDALRAASETYFMDAARLEQPPSHTWVGQGCRALGLELDETLLREITPPLFATEVENLICDGSALEAVRMLHDQGYALGCVTNTLADGTAIRAMLRNHGFEELMHSIVVSADEGWRKPHASLFEKALRELDVSSDEAIFVGDSPLHDIGGAQAVGMRAVLTRQYVARPTEGLAVADATIEHLRELRYVIARFDEDSP
jgi:HAD superfamily hydrolase (TIGR01662 family)